MRLLTAGSSVRAGQGEPRRLLYIMQETFFYVARTLGWTFAGTLGWTFGWTFFNFMVQLILRQEEIAL
jgi:hypothetical protein